MGQYASVTECHPPREDFALDGEEFLASTTCSSSNWDFTMSGERRRCVLYGRYAGFIRGRCRNHALFRSARYRLSRRLDDSAAKTLFDLRSSASATWLTSAAANGSVRTALLPPPAGDERPRDTHQAALAVQSVSLRSAQPPCRCPRALRGQLAWGS